MIIIELPVVLVNKDKARLQVDISIDGHNKTVWFEVDREYKEFLCYERSDAFVVALLSYAMRNGHDIICKAPLGEDLFYQIDNYLIDPIFKGSRKLYRTNIYANVDPEKLVTGSAVGTGISGGIDSFHTIATHTNSSFQRHNITHLMFNNVGSHGFGATGDFLYAGRLNAVRKFANEFKYNLIVSNSNIHNEIPQDHYLTHTYTSCFSVFCLQKLFSIYYYSSSHSFLEFSLKNNERYGPGAYELLILSMFSTSSLKFLSEGGAISRIEKTRKVVEFTPSYNYLNVCTDSVNNCCRCEKCTRTLLALDAINRLNDYKTVFDVDYYLSNRQKYLKDLVYYNCRGVSDYREIYPFLKKEIKFSTRLRGYIKTVRFFVLLIMPSGFKSFLKKAVGRYA